jgi:imidazole glycerol-phosphate synthase subunit HisH
MITIIDYGSGNISAIKNIYEKLRIPYNIASKPNQMNNVSKIILPGVGDYDTVMQTLNRSGFRAKLDEFVIEKHIPLLGICVGMQILTEGSEEGKLPGLGWISGYVNKIDTNKILKKPKIPHLGWNSIKIQRKNELFNNVNSEIGFYFIHSYYFSCKETHDIIATTYYGNEFASAVNMDHIYGVQFHPEKSHQNGITLLKNFAGLSIC